MTDLSNAEKRAIWMECWDWVESMSEWEYDDGQREALRRYPDPKEPTIEERVNAIPEVKAYREWQEKWKLDPWVGLRECCDHADAMIDALHDLIAQESLTNTQEKK